MLFNRAFFVSVYQISDSRATTENHFAESDEILSSMIISIVPDGNYYTKSKLHKIEALVNPELVDINEINYPRFTISITHGFIDNRLTENFSFNGQF